MSWLRLLQRDRRGASATEYLILVAVVALIGLAGFRLFGQRVFSATLREGACIASLDGSGCKAEGSAAGGRSTPAGTPTSSESGVATLASMKDFFQINVGPNGETCVGRACIGGSCFVAGTPVATPEGPRPIETIREGDLVLSADPTTREVVARRVVQTFETPGREVMRLSVSARGATETVGVTPNHRFWVEGSGWTEARDVAPGSEGFAPAGTVSFQSVEPTSERATVYNLEVEETHTYFVGRTQVVVHNDCITDAETGPLHDPKRRAAIEELAKYGPYNDKTFGILANAVFGERQAKDAAKQEKWKLHEAKQITFDAYWDFHKKVEGESWFPNAWQALKQALYEGDPRATRAVQQLIEQAKALGVEADWGGERMREAQRLIAKNTPPKPTGRPGDKFIVPDLSKATLDSIPIEHKLGIADWWMKLSDTERRTVNEALRELEDPAGKERALRELKLWDYYQKLSDAEKAKTDEAIRSKVVSPKQIELLKGLASDEISKRVVEKIPRPGDAWLRDLPPPVAEGVSKLSDLKRAAMEARWSTISNDEAEALMNQLLKMAIDGNQPPGVLARTMYNKLVPPNDSLGRWLRYEIALREGELSFQAYVELTSRQIPAMAKEEQRRAAEQEESRKRELVARIQKIMADPGLLKRGKRDAKFLEVAERGDLAKTGHFLLGFGKQGVDTVVGIGEMVIHPIDTAKGLWFAVTNPDKSIPALIVSIDESYHDDPDQFMGRVTFEITLAAATMGGGEGASAADKARKMSRLAKEAREAGDLAKAIRYAEAAEKIALQAEKVAAKGGDVAEAARIAAEARAAARGAQEIAGAAKAELVTRASKLLALADEAYPKYAKELGPAKEAVQKTLGEFGEVQARAKDPVSAANRLERAINRFGAKVEALDDVLKNLWDAIGTRVVLKDPSPANIDKLVDKLAAAIKSGELRVVEINNLHGPGGKPYFSPQQLERLKQAAAEAGKPLKINESKLMDSGYTVVCVYLEHGGGVRGELQIIGQKTLELANVEHIPYDVSLGKPLVRAIDPAAVPEMQRIVKPVEDAMRGFTPEKWAEYNKYLNEAYIHARNQELGIPSKPPKLPDGFPDVLSVEGLKRVDAEIKALKAKYGDPPSGLSPRTRLEQTRPPSAVGAVGPTGMPKTLATNLTPTEVAEATKYSDDLARIAGEIGKDPLGTAKKLAALDWKKVKVSWDPPVEMGESQFTRLAKEAEELAKQAGVTKAEALEYLIDEKFNSMLSHGQKYFYDPRTGEVHVPRDFVVYKDGVRRPLDLNDPIERAFAERHARALVEEFAHGAGSAVRPGYYTPLTPKLADFQKWLGEPETQAWLKTQFTAEEIADMPKHMHEADITALLKNRSPHSSGELGRYKIREAYEEFSATATKVADKASDTAKVAKLIAELAEQGIKHNPDAIVKIAKTAEGKIVFLEKGVSKTASSKPSGLVHIIEEHADDFAKVGIPEEKIADAVMEAVTNGKIVGYQGNGTGRPIYEVTIDGKTQYIAVTTGSNGYIVGANPTSWPKK